MSSPFDYIKYDAKATNEQAAFKNQCEKLALMITTIVSPRAKALAQTKLEECYMWIGKGLRDDQVARNGSAELQEERKNG